MRFMASPFVFPPIHTPFCHVAPPRSSGAERSDAVESVGATAVPAPYVADWSRDLFDGGAASEQAFAVVPEGALAVVAFDRMSREDADRARDAVARIEPDMMWLPAIGLDRHTPLIGLRALADLASSGPAADGGDGRTQRGIYRPITPLYSAPSVPLEAEDR
jgi:hypothetical protein